MNSMRLGTRKEMVLIATKPSSIRRPDLGRVRCDLAVAVGPVQSRKAFLRVESGHCPALLSRVSKKQRQSSRLRSTIFFDTRVSVLVSATRVASPSYLPRKQAVRIKLPGECHF